MNNSWIFYYQGYLYPVIRHRPQCLWCSVACFCNRAVAPQYPCCSQSAWAETFCMLWIYGWHLCRSPGNPRPMHSVSPWYGHQRSSPTKVNVEINFSIHLALRYLRLIRRLLKYCLLKKTFLVWRDRKQRDRNNKWLSLGALKVLRYSTPVTPIEY